MPASVTATAMPSTTITVACVRRIGMGMGRLRPASRTSAEVRRISLRAVRLVFLLRPSHHVRIVMNHLPKQGLAVRSILRRIQNVLVPELIEIIAAL